MSNIDNQVQNLFDIVQLKKAEIAKAEKPSWETNCSFGYDPNSSSRINIQVLSDLDELKRITGFLINEKENNEKASVVLGLKSNFKWMGFTFNQWINDIKNRVSKIEISKKRIELEGLESRLNSLISPELKAKLELEAITKELGI